MSAETLADLDPNALHEDAATNRAEAFRLLDEADAASIRAELSRKLAGAEVALLMAQGRVETARKHHDEAAAEIELAEIEQRERTERVRAKLADELGEDLANEVAAHLAATVAEREAEDTRAQLRNGLAQAGAPSLMVAAVVETLDDRERAQRADRATRLANAQAEVAQAQTQEQTAAAEVERLEAAIADPLNLDRFELCDAWLARLVRPQVYRAVISTRVNGGHVDELVYSLALTSAREQWRLDAALAGDLDQLDAQREALTRAQAELEKLRRAARITPTATAITNGVTGWM